MINLCYMPICVSDDDVLDAIHEQLSINVAGMDKTEEVRCEQGRLCLCHITGGYSALCTSFLIGENHYTISDYYSMIPTNHFAFSNVFPVYTTVARVSSREIYLGEKLSLDLGMTTSISCVNSLN